MQTRLRSDLAASSSQRRLSCRDRRWLHGCEVHERAVVVDGGVQFGLAGARQVALRLEELERGGQADREALLLGLEPLLSQLARLARCLDSLQVRVDLASCFADRCRDLHLEVRQARLLLLLLKFPLRDRRVGLARAEWVRDVDGKAPRLEVVAEHVAQYVAEAADGTDSALRHVEDLAIRAGIPIVELRSANPRDTVTRGEIDTRESLIMGEPQVEVGSLYLQLELQLLSPF